MNYGTRSPKRMTELNRQREVQVRYGALVRGIPRLHRHVSSLSPADITSFEVPNNHLPRLSTDAALTGFAQSACMRVGATRAMVSLIDGCCQYILAEATPDLFLRSDQSENACKELWLGTVSLPRHWSVYHSLLCDDDGTEGFASSTPSILIINDLASDENYKHRSYVTGAPYIRFFAGVPLVSTKGAIVGTLSVLDDKPRTNLSEKEILHLKDLADTVVEYLDLCMIREQNQRGEKLTRALVSFAAGDSVTRPFENESQRQLSANGAELPDLPEETKAPALAKPKKLPQVGDAKLAPDRYNSVLSLQESILSADIRSLFARAASVIQTSSDLDGVLILDASVAGVGNEQHDNAATSGDASDGSSTKTSSNEDEESQASPFFGKSSSKPSHKICQILGFATPGRSDFEGDNATTEYQSFSERDLSRMFQMYPGGKIIEFMADGEMVTTDESDPGRVLRVGEEVTEGISRRPDISGKIRTAKALRKMLPGARSVVFVPLWDYERSRWFAGCLCWSDRPDRKLTHKYDLAYFKVFGHSIMSDLSRLDAIAAEQAKSSFVASISHEMRSPLHGILGTLEFLNDTALDSFQISMINSLGACGHTLLDTINHVLDYANITGTYKSKSTRRLMGTKGVHVSSKPIKKHSHDHHMSQHPAVNLLSITEETVEAVYLGQSYAIGDWEDNGSNFDTPISDTTSLRHNGNKRTDRYITLDMANEETWTYHILPGSWRRIVMNLLINALKYTNEGYIHVSLRSAPNPDNMDERNIRLCIKDSGRGMSQQFLANRAFRPFQQENINSSGTGLGLSIVRQIIDSVGGKISVTSDQASGTEVRLQLALLKSDRPVVESTQQTHYVSILSQLKGRRICILHMPESTRLKFGATITNHDALKRFTKAIAYTLSNHLKMQVIETENWEEKDVDLVICPEPCFDYLASIRRRRTINQRAPAVIFVAIDALEAATLRTDARVKSKESVVEVMMQPCGPYKMANVLDHCLDRFASPEENIWFPEFPRQSPLPSIIRPAPKGADKSHFFVIQDDDMRSGISIGTSVVTASCKTSSSNDRGPSMEDIGTAATSIAPPGTGKIRPPLGSRQTTTGSLNMEKVDPATICSSELMTTSFGFMSPGTEVGYSGLGTFSRTRIFPSRVLVTDDNALLVAFMRKSKLMYKEAVDGSDALQAYKNASPARFDVILMDVSMPIMDGMSATRAIREYERQFDLPRCYIIALTGLTSASARLEAWSSGVDHYMTKPVNFKKLDAVLKDETAKREREVKMLKGEQGFFLV